MLLYKITYEVEGIPIDTESKYTTKSKWVGSQSDAASFRKVARQKTGFVPNSVVTSKINVPVDKLGLIEFLNSNRLQHGKYIQS